MFGVAVRGVVQAHPAGLHRRHAQPDQTARVRRHRYEVQQAQVVAVLLIAVDALVVVDEIAAAVQDEPAAVDLDRPGGARNARASRPPTIDDPVREVDVLHGHLVIEPPRIL